MEGIVTESILLQSGIARWGLTSGFSRGRKSDPLLALEVGGGFHQACTMTMVMRQGQLAWTPQDSRPLPAKGLQQRPHAAPIASRSIINAGNSAALLERPDNGRHGARRMISTGASQRAGMEPLIEADAHGLRRCRSSIQAENLPPLLRPELLPALEILLQQVRPQGLWLFGSWARGTASRRSDVDLLVMGLEHCRLLDAYDAVLEALQPCPLPLQPLVATPQLLARHGDAPFWRTLRAEAIPLLDGSRFP